MTNKSNKKEFNPMKTSTRKWFIAMFANSNGGINYEKAAKYCCVSSRTVRHWWSSSCPPWIDKMAELAARSIPDAKEWDGFKFINDRLYTPYDRLTFSPSELLKIHYDRQFNRFDRVEREKLKGLVKDLRNDEEAAAIREEIDFMISALAKIKQSPIVAPALGVHQKVSKKR